MLLISNELLQHVMRCV